MGGDGRTGSRLHKSPLRAPALGLDPPKPTPDTCKKGLSRAFRSLGTSPGLRSNRVATDNQLLRIEDELGSQAVYAGAVDRGPRGKV